jgi:hypothetical protein
MIPKFRKPLVAAFFAVYLFSLSGIPATAGMVGSFSTSQQVTSREARHAEINKVQRALENQIVRAKLEAYGFTPDEITAKLQGMTDQQIHLLAQASEDVLAGADDGLGVLIAILLIVLIVILILKLSGKSIVIK